MRFGQAAGHNPDTDLVTLLEAKTGIFFGILRIMEYFQVSAWSQ